MNPFSLCIQLAMLTYLYPSDLSFMVAYSYCTSSTLLAPYFLQCNICRLLRIQKHFITKIAKACSRRIFLHLVCLMLSLECELNVRIIIGLRDMRCLPPSNESSGIQTSQGLNLAKFFICIYLHYIPSLKLTTTFQTLLFPYVSCRLEFG
ncbi:hypothetical protein DsansV1_C19g0162211 [Dioscorea sansibarensis]